MNKQVLRTLFLDKRKTLTDTEFDNRNSALFTNTMAFIRANQHLKHQHLFLSIEKFREPNTWPIFHWLLQSSQHAVYLSKTHFKSKRLTHYLVHADTELKKANFGIPEPVNAPEADPTALDIVFVPLICFDLTGNRIGYGAGLYDRFLSQLSPDCLKVGIAITPPLDHIDYADSRDVKIDACISHLGIQHFR